MDSLQQKQQLNVNDQLVSNNGLFNCIMQGDGNLVLYRTHFGRPLWASDTSGKPVNHTVMQDDGNLVAYSATEIPYWATGTDGHPGARVVLQDDGNLVVYDSANNPLWASNTVQDLLSPTIRYSDTNGYSYNETSESWKELCRSLPCFAALQWPGYATDFVEDVIDRQPVVIQLWKGWCPKFLGFLGLQIFPGGIGAEVGVYRRIPGKVRPTSLPFLPAALEALVLNALGTLGDNELWWPFPELGTEIEFTLINPVTSQQFFPAGPEKSYWLAKWMNEGSYFKYQTDQGLNWPWLPALVPGNSKNTPPRWEDYILDYRINGESYPQWSVGKASPRTTPNGPPLPVLQSIRVATYLPYVEKVGTDIDFGTVSIIPGGWGKSGLVIVRNSGTGTITLSNPTLSGDFNATNTRVTLVQPFATKANEASLRLDFGPKESGPLLGTLNIALEPLNPVVITLKAEAVGELKLEITPSGPRLPALDFGGVTVGNSKNLAITVRNLGDVDAAVSDMTLFNETPGGQFQVPFIIPDRTVPVGQARAFNIAYIPTIGGEAMAVVRLIAVSTTSLSMQQKGYLIEVWGIGTGPAVDLSPTTLNFADQLVRTDSTPQTVTLRNVGTAPLTITNISASHEFAQTNSYVTSLAPEQSCDIAVSFRPAGGGTRTGMLIIDSDAIGNPHTVALSGVGLVEPIVTLSPASLSFGNQPVGTSGAEQTITVTNDGAADLQVSGVALVGPDAGDFVVTADSCNGVLITPERTCTVSVRFNPNATGTRNAGLEFSTNVGGSPHQVALSGAGVPPPAVTLNPTSLSFSNQQVGDSGTTQRVMLTNNGAGPLVITSISFTGAHPDDFKIGAETCAGTTLVPGDSCTVDLSFTPRAVGSRSAALAFASNAPGSPQTVALNGTGIEPAVSFDPPSLLFPPQPVDSISQRQEVTLTNTGNTILNISSITVSGDFRHDTFCGGSLAPGAFCVIRVICVPTAAGTRLGEITILDDAAGSPHTVPLSGTGTEPIATLNPTVLDFGSQPVSTRSATQMVTLTNTGLAPMTISNVSLSGANPNDFIITADSCAGSALQPGLSCSVRVQFAPTVVGSSSANLVFTDNASDSPQSVPLNGSGV